MSPRTAVTKQQAARRPAAKAVAHAPAKSAPKSAPKKKSARAARPSAEATAARAAALADVIALVRGHADPEDAVGLALDRLGETVAFESATLFLLDEAGGGLRPAATRGAHVDLIPDVRFDLGTGLSSWVARTGRPVLLSDLRGEARPDAPEAPRHGSFVSVPLLVEGGSVGVLNAGSRRPGAFNEADRDLLVAAGAALAAPLLARRAAREAERRPGVDAASGLPNRLAFEERVAEAIERGRRYAERCAVVVLAVDGVAALRRAAGEAAASEALAAAAAVLAGRSRDSDVVARLAPDDAFALLLPHQGEEAASRAIDRLVVAIARHGFAGRGRLRVASGLCLWPVARGPGADPFAPAATCAQEMVAAALAVARDRVAAGAAPGAPVAAEAA